ncbi:MAG: hypothetical protein ACI8XX_000154 [Polaribacter sp.]|jgi:uncharacterized protein YkwD
MNRILPLIVILLSTSTVPLPSIAQSDYLSALEKEVLAQMNLARTNPKEFSKAIIKYRSYYDSQGMVHIPGEITLGTNEGVEAVDEAIRALAEQSPIAAIKPSKGMSAGARDHVKDQGPKGDTGHSGSDGSDPFTRVNRYGEWDVTAGENISYGADTGVGVILQLIIDDGVPSRGHRENIFNANFLVSGVACGSHKVYRHMCVINYAGSYKEK